MIRKKADSIPALSLNLFLTYMSKMTRVDVTGCRTADECMSLIGSAENIALPMGINQDCSVILERRPYLAQLWNFSPKTLLGQLCGQMAHGDYFIVADTGLTGIESLFLYTSGITDSLRFRQDDIAETMRSWLMYGNPKIFTGAYTFPDTDPEPYMYAVGVQLISLFRR